MLITRGMRAVVRQTPTWLNAVPLALWLGGCGVVETDCPLGAAPGIKVEVRDAITQSPAVEGVTGLVYRDGESDPLSEGLVKQSPLLMIAYVGPGLYSVELRKMGYRTWIVSGVRVEREGQCDLKPAQLQARLEPLG